MVAADVAWRARSSTVLSLNESIAPIAATLFADDVAAQQLFVALFGDIVDAQRQLLIFGNFSGASVPPGGFNGYPGMKRTVGLFDFFSFHSTFVGVRKRNGMGYIEGWDTWQELAKIAGDISLLGNTSLMTAPDRLSIELAV